jgi:hypothetical protein
MRIVRQTESELVVEDSSLWMTVLCALCAVFIFWIALTHGQYKTMISGGIFLLIGLVCLRKATFVLSAKAQSIRWTRLRMGRIKTGNIAFSDVQDIVIESTIASGARLRCRLSIRTGAGTTPMSDGYSASQDHAATVRATLLDFVLTASGAKTAGDANTVNTDAIRTRQLNDSIRSLLLQGKRIDAILLVQQSEHLDLTEATYRVNQVASQMGTKQTAPRA